MTLEELHQAPKEVSVAGLFKGETGVISSIRLSKDGKLKEHITKIRALLLCVTGQVVYHEEGGRTIPLSPGHYVQIPPEVKHWLDGTEDAQLILMK